MFSFFNLKNIYFSERSFQKAPWYFSWVNSLLLPLKSLLPGICHVALWRDPSVWWDSKSSDSAGHSEASTSIVFCMNSGQVVWPLFFYVKQNKKYPIHCMVYWEIHEKLMCTQNWEYFLWKGKSKPDDLCHSVHSSHVLAVSFRLSLSNVEYWWSLDLCSYLRIRNWKLIGCCQNTSYSCVSISGETEPCTLKSTLRAKKWEFQGSPF